MSSRRRSSVVVGKLIESAGQACRRAPAECLSGWWRHVMLRPLACLKQRKKCSQPANIIRLVNLSPYHYTTAAVWTWCISLHVRLVFTLHFKFSETVSAWLFTLNLTQWRHCIIYYLFHLKTPTLDSPHRHKWMKSLEVPVLGESDCGRTKEWFTVFTSRPTLLFSLRNGAKQKEE